MKALFKPLFVGLFVAGAAWGTNVSYGQTAATNPLPGLQAQLVELQAKLQEANPANQALLNELGAAIGQVQANINAVVEAQYKAPEHPATTVEDHTINTEVQVADPNWVPSFISTGNAAQDAEIVHQYKVAKGLEKDHE